MRLIQLRGILLATVLPILLNWSSTSCAAFQTVTKRNICESSAKSSFGIHKKTFAYTNSNLFSSNNNKNGSDESILDRFVSPKIDDKGLPIADVLVAQIVSPTLQVFWLSLNHAPIPSWLTIIPKPAGVLFSTPAQGSLLAPTLIHGAGLAVCWTLGSLAAQGFQSDAFNISGGRGYSTVISRIIQAGAFASGILILSTQVDLFLEFGRTVSFGESQESDVRLLQAAVELINDIFFEALVVGSWRLYRASLTGNADGRPPNYEP